MAKKTYGELLKDPRWQKKRLEIMQRDNFMCQECGDDKSPLAVHHLIYYTNRLPWEYDNDELKTLCEGCHISLHDDYESVKKIASQFNAEVLHYAVDILWKMAFLYPPDCADVLELVTELAKINTENNHGKKIH